MKIFEISLENLHIFARHGCLPQESLVGNEFVVDIVLRIPFSSDIEDDNIEATISYADVYEIVAEEMGKTCKLLETVASSIHNKLTQRWPQILSGKISICKTKPPIRGIDGSAKVSLIF